MALFLEVIEGPGEGQKFKLVAGIRLGRTTGEIRVADPKASALHAQVESNENGQLFLVDRDSSNGLRISGQRVRKVALLPGVRFAIGRTRFRVIELFGDHPDVPDLEPGGNWQKILMTEIPRLNSRNLTQATAVESFNPMIELQFLEGIQASSKITLGYGPRRAGSDVLDIELQDPEAPDVAFELVPVGEGQVRFQTAFPDIVQLNDVAISSDILKSGDLIRIGNSLIEVHFLK